MAPKGESDTGGLPDAVSDPAEALDPGGIDFTPLQLRYLSLSGPHRGDVQYAIDGDGAPVTTDPSTGLQTAQQDSAAFFNWLTLPASTFWVNLSPNFPPNIIDPRFALTDAGRVLLKSDLLLKRTSIASQKHSYTSSARREVKMAVVTHLPGTMLDPICPQDAWDTTFLTGFRQFILPQVTQEVNTAPQFEPLRRVHMSRVAAQWVGEQAGPHTAMGRLVDSGLHKSWTAHPNWSPNAVWERCLRQFNAAPTAYTMPAQEGGTTVNVTVYASGEVDLRQKVRETDTSNRQFKAHWPGSWRPPPRTRPSGRPRPTGRRWLAAA